MDLYPFVRNFTTVKACNLKYK